MAANLNPSEQAIYPEAIAALKSYLDSIPPADKETVLVDIYDETNELLMDLIRTAPAAGGVDDIASAR